MSNHLGALTSTVAFLLAGMLPAQVEIPENISLAEFLGDRWTVEAQVYSQIGPAVVSIDVSGVMEQRGWPFGGQRRRSGHLGQGTGVIIDASGLIITNAHVAAPRGNGIAEGSITLEVSFADEFGGEIYPATLLNVDYEWDLALLKIEAKGPFTYAPLGKSSDLIKGEKVIAIGTPLGNSHSITSGIISGVHRDIIVNVNGGKKKIPGLIQTDAAINPGNSGGPLLNAYGELIGINNATMEAADGIGFAIPVDRVAEILEQRLLDAGRSSRFWVGLTVEEIDGQLMVVDVDKRGPAALAGLHTGSVVYGVDGEAVVTRTDYATRMLPHSAGDTITLSLKTPRGSRDISFELLPTRSRDTIGYLGFDAVRDVVVLRRRNGFRSRVPILRVTRVYPETGASALGLLIDDAIVGVRMETSLRGSEWQEVRSLSELVSHFRGSKLAKSGDNLWVLRGDDSFKGRLEVPADG